MYALIIGTGAALAILAGLSYYSDESQKSQIHVYPETENRYLVKGMVKMKDIDSGEWTDAVLYASMKNRHHYVREKRRFLDKFITLKEWGKQDGNSK